MDRFNICQAFQQLEADYNVNGFLAERPSNQRRRESIGCQLSRMGYSAPMAWVDIEAEPEEGDYEGEEVRAIYCAHALAWGLPIAPELAAVCRRLFVPEYLAQFPQLAQ